MVVCGTQAYLMRLKQSMIEKIVRTTINNRNSCLTKTIVATWQLFSLGIYLCTVNILNIGTVEYDRVMIEYDQMQNYKKARQAWANSVDPDKEIGCPNI